MVLLNYIIKKQHQQLQHKASTSETSEKFTIFILKKDTIKKKIEHTLFKKNV